MAAREFIGLVADAIATTPFAGQIIHGAQDEAWEHGYVLLVANTDGNARPRTRRIAMMLEHQVRGILYSTWYHRAVDVPADAASRPTSCWSTASPRAAELPAVVPDEVQGGRTATELLLGRGPPTDRVHQHDDTVARPRAAASRDTATRSEAAGIAFDESLVFDAEPDQEGGYATRDARIVEPTGDRRVLPQRPGRDGSLRRPARTRPRASRTISPSWASTTRRSSPRTSGPPLSTVALPHYELGAAGVRMLLGLEHAPESGRLEVACPPVLRDSI